MGKNRQKEEQKFTLCTKISNIGLWMSADDTITSLSKLPNKKAALKDHLKFREVILGQDYIDLSVFKVQKKRRIFHLRSYWVDNLCKWYLGNFQQLVDQPKAVDWNTHSAQV